MDLLDRLLSVAGFIFLFVGIAMCMDSLSDIDKRLKTLEGEEILYKIEKDEKGILHAIPVDQ